MECVNLWLVICVRMYQEWVIRYVMNKNAKDIYFDLNVKGKRCMKYRL